MFFSFFFLFLFSLALICVDEQRCACSIGHSILVILVKPWNLETPVSLQQTRNKKS